MKYYHASPRSDLHKIGLTPKAKPFVSYWAQNSVYLGSWNYLHEQYFRYAPKTVYHIYEVYVEDLQLDETPVGEQVRVFQFIEPKRIRFETKYINK